MTKAPGITVQHDAVRIERRWWPPIVALLPALCSALLVFVAHDEALVALSVALPIGVGVASRILYRNSYARRSKGQLRVDRSGVFLSEEPILATPDLRGAHLEGNRVLIQRPWRESLVFVMPTKKHAREILYGLGYDKSQRHSFSVSSPHAGWFMIAGLAVMLLQSAFDGFPPWRVALLGFGLVLCILGFWSADVQVDSSGVLMKWLTTERFFPIESIDRTTYTETTTSKGGKQREVAIHFNDAKTYCLAGAPNELHERIERLIMERRTQQGVDPLLRRGGRSTKQWYDALMRAGEDLTSSHQPPIATKRLWRVLSDDALHADTRVAAAIALRSHLDDAVRQRLLSTAERLKAPRLSIALRGIAEDTLNDDQLRSTLDAGSAPTMRAQDLE